jgi:hypothetical protein
MRSKSTWAFLVVGLLFLAGCGSAGKAQLAPPLVLPTAPLGTPGPVPLSVYFGSESTGASPRYTVSAIDASAGATRSKETGARQCWTRGGLFWLRRSEGVRA